MQELVNNLLSFSRKIRYVAIYHNHQLTTSSRDTSLNTSSPESDQYEELIVNPTILTLIQQRGNIDCGGAQYALIRYGNFYQLIIPLPEGHVSICLELEADPLALVEPMENFLKQFFD